MTARQIAEVLVIAEGTVRRHLGNAYKKLGAAGRLDAVIHAVSAGLVSPAALADEFIPGSVPPPAQPPGRPRRRRASRRVMTAAACPHTPWQRRLSLLPTYDVPTDSARLCSVSATPKAGL